MKRCRFISCYQYVTSVRTSCAELSQSELDMMMLRQLMASVNTSSEVNSIAAHQKEDEHKKVYTSFLHQVCVRRFRFLHDVGNKWLKNLMRSLKENGLTLQVQSNTEKKPNHVLSYSSDEFVEQFLFFYVRSFATLVLSACTSIPNQNQSCDNLLGRSGLGPTTFWSSLPT